MDLNVKSIIMFDQQNPLIPRFEWAYLIFQTYLHFSESPLQCYHNECGGVSNHRRLVCLHNRLFGRWSKKTSKPRVTDLCEGNSPMNSPPVNSPHKGPVTRKMFPFDDVVMHTWGRWFQEYAKSSGEMTYILRPVPDNTTTLCPPEREITAHWILYPVHAEQGSPYLEIERWTAANTLWK